MIQFASRVSVQGLVFSTLISFSGLATAQAPAQPATQAAEAEALFNEGRKLAAAGRFAEACPKFEQSERLDPALGTLLNMADCYERVGRLGSAYRGFLDAAARAQAEGYPDAVRGARERSDALAPQVPKLVIVAPKSAPAGLRITQDGVVLEPATWGQPLPVDPGTHHIAASAPGAQAWETSVVLEKGATKTVDVPELGAAPNSGAQLAAAESGTGSTSATQFHWSGARIGAVAAAGVGVVGLTLGSVFGLKSMSKRDDADKHCEGQDCRDQEGVDLRQQALDAGNISTIAFAVGAVGLTTGAVLWFTAGSAEKPATALRVGPTSVAFSTAF